MSFEQLMVLMGYLILPRTSFETIADGTTYTPEVHFARLRLAYLRDGPYRLTIE